MTDVSLNGAGILLTRPEAQSQELAAAIRDHGGNPVIFPALVIVARDAAAISADAASLPAPDITIFISRNAVEHGMAWASGRLAAIGPTTAAAIDAAGGSVAIQPLSGYDSEALLAEPPFSEIGGKTVRIIRGDAGRELLGDTLRARGARVDYLATYERRVPEPSAAELAAIDAAWASDNIAATVVMSVQSLKNLGRILSPASGERLATTPLVTPAARVLKEARTAYPDCPAILAAGPRTGELVKAIAGALARNARGPD